MADKKNGFKGLLSKGPVKVIAVLLLLVAPIIILVVVFRPMAKKRVNKEFVAKYTLPKNYTAEDIVNIIKKMRKDREFEFYFYALGNDRIAQLTENIVSIMKSTRKDDLLLNVIKAKRQEVHYLGVFFLNINFPNDFFVNPDKYPQLSSSMWNFISREFEVTLLSICYKSLYNPKFELTWDKSDFMAAVKLKEVMMVLKNAKK